MDTDTDKTRHDVTDRHNEPEEPEGPGPEVVRKLPEAIQNDGKSEEALVPSDPLQLYIGKIRQYPALTRDEERELAIRYKETGDKETAFRLVTSNLMLVVKIAFEFRSQFQNMLDLIQEGNYGLMRAIQRFDPFKGTRLSTYAAYWIRAYILKFLLDNWRLVRVGTTNTRRKLLYRLREMENRLSEAGTVPTTRLLAEHFGASEEDIEAVRLSLGAADKSIHQPVEEGSKREVIDVLPGGGAGDFAEELGERQLIERFRDAVERFKETLKPSDRTLLEERILSEDPLTLQQIGDKHGVTREAVRQAETRLMKRLKRYLSGELADVDEIGSAPHRT